MFGFKMRKLILARARFLGEILPLIDKEINSMPFEDFVQNNRRRGFVDNFIDVQSRAYGFSKTVSASVPSDFAFFVQYEEPPCGPLVGVEGKSYFYGCNVTFSAGKLNAGLVTDTIPTAELGRHARSLYKALLTLPNVTTLEQMMRRLGG